MPRAGRRVRVCLAPRPRLARQFLPPKRLPNGGGSLVRRRGSQVPANDCGRLCRYLRACSSRCRWENRPGHGCRPGRPSQSAVIIPPDIQLVAFRLRSRLPVAPAAVRFVCTHFGAGTPGDGGGRRAVSCGRFRSPFCFYDGGSYDLVAGARLEVCASQACTGYALGASLLRDAGTFNAITSISISEEPAGGHCAGHAAPPPITRRTAFNNASTVKGLCSIAANFSSDPGRSS